MIGYRGQLRRTRKAVRRSSFKPLLDVLEDRVQPSAGYISPEPLMPIDPMPPIGSSPGVISVSTQYLQLTRGGSSESFTVVLNSQPSAEVDATLAVYDPDAATDGTTVTIDQPHLVFTTDDWNTPQTVNVSAAAGTTPLADAELSIFGTTTSADTNFDAQAVPPITVDVTDPAPTGGITLSTNQLSVQVGGSGTAYTMVLNSQPTADVTVQISQASPILDQPLPGSAQPMIAVLFQPLTVTPKTLTFSPDDWNQPQTITVSAPALSNALGRYAPVVYLDSTVTSDDPNYNGISVTPVEVDVSAPQPTGGIVVSTQSLTVTAGGPSVTYTIALASQPNADVTVTINQFSPVVDPPGPLANVVMIAQPIGWGGMTTLNIAPGTLTFTPDDWNTPQTITVSAPNGSVSPYGGFVVLTDSATSDDPNYNNIDGPSVDVKVQNNPAYSLVVSTNQLNLTPGGSGTYTIALASAPTDDVTITLNASSGFLFPEPLPVAMPMATASAIIGPLPPIGIGGVTLTVAPTTLTFTPDDWNTPQTVTVSASASTNGSPVYAFDRINYSLSSNDPNWNNAAEPPTTVIVSDSGGTLPVGTVPINTANHSSKPAKTSTTLTAPASAVVGQDVTLTAHVRAPAAHAATPTGTILFMDGKTALGTADVTNGIATLTVSTLDVGRHTLTAVFTSTDSTEAGSTSASVHTTIRKAATRTALSVTTNAPTAGAAPTITLMVQVNVVAPGVAPVNGVVTFRDGGHVVGKANVTNGVATLTLTTMTHGKHRFTATCQATADTLASASRPVIDTIA